MPPKTQNKPKRAPPARGPRTEKSVSRHERAGLDLPVSRIVSHLKKTGKLVGVRMDAGVYFVAGLEGFTRMLLQHAQKVARAQSSEDKLDLVRADTRHLLTAFNDSARDLSGLCGVTPHPVRAALIAEDYEKQRNDAKEERKKEEEKRAERKKKREVAAAAAAAAVEQE